MTLNAKNLKYKKLIDALMIEEAITEICIGKKKISTTKYATIWIIKKFIKGNAEYFNRLLKVNFEEKVKLPFNEKCTHSVIRYEKVIDRDRLKFK